MSQASSFSSSFREPRASQSGSQRFSSTHNHNSNMWDRVLSQGSNFLASQGVATQRFTAQSNEVKEINDIIKDAEESIMKGAKNLGTLKNQFNVEDKSLNARLVEQMRSVISLSARFDSEVRAYETSLQEVEETWRRIQNHDDQEEDQMREVEQAREHELTRNTENDDSNQSDLDEEDGDGDDDPMDGSRQNRRGRANKERGPPKKVPTKKLNKNDEAILEGARNLFTEKISSIKGPTKAAITKNPRLKELQRILQGDDSSLFPDEDIQADEVETIPVDPFTNKKIRNPVKNKTCGHVYDKRGVFAYIESRTGTRTKPRCPTIGCSNKHLTKEDLEEDDAMRRKIDRIRALTGEEDDSEEEEIEINTSTVNQDEQEEVDYSDSD
ncbi:uncharacterized protein LOC141856797 [Brevipalpus obovatus]|uniref:uncharacterized protein LOC141856797 n=1 Tax=Brevipalpus obovatus TaxID=246614 RepID=UPI003D9E509B